MRAWLSGTAGATVLAGLIAATGAVIATLLTVTLTYPRSTEEINTISVSAASDPFPSTGIVVETGDELEIAVEDHDATWVCSPGVPIGPEGRRFDRPPTIRLPNANFCELIGSIQPGVFFRVGSYYRVTVNKPGTLLLGANDGSTDISCTANCYADNTGTLNVTVIVRKK
jgi:hypothetical protein